MKDQTVALLAGFAIGMAFTVLVYVLAAVLS